MRIASVALVLAGCSGAPSPDPRLVEIGGSYASYGRVDDLKRWAPTLCKQPAPKPARLSASPDPETHGRKLYYLFAKDREAYRMARDRAQPVGQVLVKESWFPSETSTSKNPQTGERGPLFMMMKTGEPDSDEGWIYATLTADGRTVTSSGRLASCMECHTGAKYDRLFAVKCD